MNNKGSMKLDAIDFKILDLLLENGRITFKELAQSAEIDERLASRRMERMEKEGVISGFTVNVDWSKLGFETQLWIGTSTAVGEELRQKLFRFIDQNPNIVRAESSVGAHEYILNVICNNLQEFRSMIAAPLEPMTAGLHSAIITAPIKTYNLRPLLSLAKERALRQSSSKKRS
jgi:Lrp/AsnC family leucine-responsive transcriptional regulator